MREKKKKKKYALSLLHDVGAAVRVEQQLRHE